MTARKKSTTKTVQRKLSDLRSQVRRLAGGLEYHAVPDYVALLHAAADRSELRPITRKGRTP